MSLPWWKEAVFYHVYVRSFQDSNGDGIGDLPGLGQRLELLAELGADALWLSPCYPSPQADFGYDVADYRDVDPVYGTLDDLAALRDSLHGRGMKLVLDFVPNHTSSAHPWFRDALRGRDSRYRTWYYFRDPAPDGGPPNNWQSSFGGPAWTFHPPSGQYYLHSYHREQPDLDWRNPEVVAAMQDHLRFWLDWGVDGFRVDAIQRVWKDAGLRSNPPDPDYGTPLDDPSYDPKRAQLRLYDRMQPGVHQVVRGLRSLVAVYPGDRVLIGETAVMAWEEYLAFANDPQGFHLAFSFHQIKAPALAAVRREVEHLYQVLAPTAWPTLVLSNHDIERHASRLGRPTAALAKAAAAALLLARGTPFVYYGEEIGMPNTPLPPDRLLDPAGVFQRDQGRAAAPAESYGRDGARTPMHWDASPKGGFTTGEPWLPLGDTGARNLADQRRQADSVFRWYRDLLALRRVHPALSRGAYRSLAGPSGLWGFERAAEDERLRVLINCTEAPLDLGGARPAEGSPMLLASFHVGAAPAELPAHGVWIGIAA